MAILQFYWIFDSFYTIIFFKHSLPNSIYMIALILQFIKPIEEMKLKTWPEEQGS